MNDNSLIDEFKNWAILAKLTGQPREFPKEIQNLYDNKIQRLKANHLSHRAKDEERLKEFEEGLTRHKQALDVVTSRIKQLSHNYLNLILANFLIWVGFQNVIALPSLVRNFLREHSQQNFISISLAFSSVFNELKSSNLKNIIIGVILILLIILPSILPILIKKVRTDYFLQMKFSSIRTMGIIGFVLSSTVLLSSNENKMYDAEFAFSIMAAALAFSGLVLLVLLYFRMKIITEDEVSNSHLKNLLDRIEKKLANFYQKNRLFILISIAFTLLAAVSLLLFLWKSYRINYISFIFMLFSLSGMISLAVGLILQGVYWDRYFKYSDYSTALVRVEQEKTQLNTLNITYTHELTAIEQELISIKYGYLAAFDSAEFVPPIKNIDKKQSDFNKTEGVLQLKE